MTNNPLRLALIGAGTIGRVHAGCIAGSEGAQLAWIHDTNAELAQQLAAGRGGRTAASVDQILNDPGIDAVIIAASTGVHGELARACADAKKPFLCGKTAGSRSRIGGRDGQEGPPVRHIRRHGVQSPP